MGIQPKTVNVKNNAYKICLRTAKRSLTPDTVFDRLKPTYNIAIYL